MKSLNEIIKILDDYIEWAETNVFEAPICLSYDLREVKNCLLDKKFISLPFSIGTTIWSKEPFKDGVVRDGDIVEYSVGKDEISIWVNFDPEPITAEFPLNEKDRTWFLSKEDADKLK